MKNILLFTVITFLAASSLMAQSKGSTKIYAYKQSVLSGKAPGGVIYEGGTATVTKQKKSENYFIYTSSTLAIIPVVLWVKGKEYSVNAEAVTTPVYQNPKKILVPKTSNKVLRLVPKVGEPEKQFIKGKTLAAKNEVVVIYTVKGKYYYATAEKLTPLPTEVLQ